MRFLTLGLDVGVVGEAFVSFPELLRRVDAGQPDWAACPGLIWRDAAARPGSTRSSPPHGSRQPALSGLGAFPARGLLLQDKHGGSTPRKACSPSGASTSNASYGCSLICRFCFHLGIAGDMQHKENAEGENDVAFTYDRRFRFHSPRYVVTRQYASVSSASSRDLMTMTVRRQEVV